MAITFRAWGAFASGTTTASAAAAAGALSTDLHIGLVGNKPYTSIPTATNFTGGRISGAAGGAVASGNGTGSPYAAAFYKTGASAALNVAVTSGSPSMGVQCSVYSTTTGLRTPVASAAGDATLGAAVSISGTQTEGFDNGDLVLFAIASGDDAHTVTSIGLTIGGVAQTLTVEAKASTTSGNDGLMYYGRCVVSGITNGATAWVLTGTSSNTTTAYFAGTVVRIREIVNTSLVVQNAAHSQAAGTPTLTEIVNVQLTTQGAAHTQAAGNVALVQQHNLTVANARGNQAAGNVTLVQQHNLTVQPAAHAQSAGNVAMVYTPNPEWVAGAETYITASGTAVLTVPAAKQAGDLAFLVASTDGNADPLWSPPAGWTLLGHTAATNMHSYIWTRELDGSETTVSLAHSASITLVMGIWRHATLGVAGAFGIRSGTNFDITAPDITPTGYKAFLFADRTIDTGGTQPDQINSLTYGTVRYSSVGNPANDAGSAISTVYFVDAPPPRGGANTVTMADNSSNAWGLSVELVPKYGVRIQNAAHTQSAGNVGLTQQQIITAQAAAHTQAAGNVSLTQVHQLVVANARSNQTVGNVTLTQVHVLTVANARHNQTATSATPVPNLTVQNARSTQSAGSPTLVQRAPDEVDLLPQNARSTQSAQEVVLEQVITMTGIANSSHVQSATSPVLQHVQQIAQVYGSVHNQKAGHVTLVQNSTLQVEGCSHYHQTNEIRLSQFAVAYQFVTPTEPSVVFTDERLISYLRPPGGVTLLLEGGIVTEVQFPTQDQVNAADTAYIGGHQYTVTEEAAQVLRDAGYTANLYETVVEV